MMYYSSRVFWIFIYSILCVSGERELFDKKCKRECNTEEGTLDCWQSTTDGFTYGLSTAMIDYCQVILGLPQTDDKVSWYNTSHTMLVNHINKYKFGKNVRQLTGDNIELVATSLLNKCFAASPSISSFQPSCPSCTLKQNKLVKQWRLVSIIIVSTCLVFSLAILLLYISHTNHIRRSYESIG